MENEQMRRKEAEIYERLAAEFIQSAEHALAGGFRRGAVDNAYHAAELVAKALLILKLGNYSGQTLKVLFARDDPGKRCVICKLVPEFIEKNL
jgi:HEPN domain-containing protein